jgi:NAD(P)-dependent dehydrogenase (short-subunit alcohol dehydrogenase family)
MLFNDYYRGKRVLVTGHTGFKGAWLSTWLHQLGALVSGLSLPPDGSSSIYGLLPDGSFEQEHLIDVRDAAEVRRVVAEVQPDFVFHLAAQPLVRLSYQQPLETVSTNVMGTLHVLEAVRHECPQAHTLVITSDKCYENQNWHHGYRETDPILLASFLLPHQSEGRSPCHRTCGQCDRRRGLLRGPHRAGLRARLVRWQAHPRPQSACHTSLAACAGLPQWLPHPRRPHGHGRDVE